MYGISFIVHPLSHPVGYHKDIYKIEIQPQGYNQILYFGFPSIFDFDTCYYEGIIIKIEKNKIHVKYCTLKKADGKALLEVIDFQKSCLSFRPFLSDIQYCDSVNCKNANATSTHPSKCRYSIITNSPYEASYSLCGVCAIVHKLPSIEWSSMYLVEMVYCACTRSKGVRCGSSSTTWAHTNGFSRREKWKELEFVIPSNNQGEEGKVMLTMPEGSWELGFHEMAIPHLLLLLVEMLGALRILEKAQHKKLDLRED
ncbi:hypothetical protein LXL04_002333 [Taraxacum kok-saghyz]